MQAYEDLAEKTDDKVCYPSAGPDQSSKTWKHRSHPKYSSQRHRSICAMIPLPISDFPTRRCGLDHVPCVCNRGVMVSPYGYCEDRNRDNY